jgi:hypothetical protein
MKVGVVTQAVGVEYQRMVRCGIESLSNWCQHHGYTFIMSEEEFGRPPSWGKVKLIQRYIDNFDWLLVIDSDVIITNPKITVETIVRVHEGERFDILMTLMTSVLSCGVMLIKRSDWIKSFCDVWWDQEDLIHHKFWEQEAFKRLYHQNFDRLKYRTHLVDYRWLNSSFAGWVEGDFLAHFASWGKAGGRMEQMYQRFVFPPDVPLV